MDEIRNVQKLAVELEQGGSAMANNVVLLLAVVEASREQGAVKAAVQALKLFFVDASQDGDLGAKKLKLDEAQPGTASSGGQDDGEAATAAEDVYRQWLRRQYAAYTSSLFKLLSSPIATSSIQISATTALMEAVRCEMGVGVFASGTYCQLLTTLVTSAAVKPEALTLMFTKYFPYADVRHYTLWAVREIALARTRPEARGSKEAAGKRTGSYVNQTELQYGEEMPAQDVARSLFDVLANIPDSCGAAAGSSKAGAAKEAATKEKMKSWCGLEEAAGGLKAAAHKSESSKARRKRKLQDLQEGRKAAAAEQQASWANPRTQRKMFSEAWGAYLQMPVPADIYRKVLLRLHSHVIPSMANPVLLADFLTYALNQGGIVGMLALNGIFVLVTQHGLEYPAFYTRLYNLITAESFAVKHRVQFFKLADLFLSSGLVPAYTAAAFAKRMARLSVSAPPAGAMTAIAFIHNLIRRHPACMVLLDNPEPASEGAGADVYDPSQEDPAKSRAVESSLWELACLRNHYCPQVSALCAILDKNLVDRTKTTEVDVDPLLNASYSSLFAQEAERRLKQVPLAFYQEPPTKLFDVNSNADFEGWTL